MVFVNAMREVLGLEDLYRSKKRGSSRAKVAVTAGNPNPTCFFEKPKPELGSADGIEVTF